MGSALMGYALSSSIYFIFAAILAIVSIVGIPVDLFDVIFRDLHALNKFTMTSTLLLFASLGTSLFVAYKFNKRISPDIKKYYYLLKL